jgi:hypothetical protein
MFGRKADLRETKRRLEQEREATYKAREKQGADITKRLYEMRQLDPADRLAAVLDLFKEARHQLALIRQSIADRTHYDFMFEGEELPEGDLATSLAEDITGVMRENTVNPQTVWQALTEQFPDVNFTVDWYDATSMAAAMIREMHLEVLSIELLVVVHRDLVRTARVRTVMEFLADLAPKR